MFLLILVLVELLDDITTFLILARGDTGLAGGARTLSPRLFILTLDLQEMSTNRLNLICFSVVLQETVSPVNSEGGERELSLLEAAFSEERWWVGCVIIVGLTLGWLHTRKGVTLHLRCRYIKIKWGLLIFQIAFYTGG